MSESVNYTIENAVLEPSEDLDKLQSRAWAVGGVFAILTGVGFFVDSDQFFRPYLIAWLLWLGVAMGLFALCMLNHISGGRWGILLRRVFEAAGRTLPFFLITSIPLFFGIDKLFYWSIESVVAKDAILQHKVPYLNEPFFIYRNIAILILWAILAYAMSNLSRRQDETGDKVYKDRMGKLGAGGLVIYMLTGTLVSVDWMMSLEPHWFSSLMGAAFVVGQALSGFAFSIVMLAFLSKRKPYVDIPLVGRFHDYGKLMFALVVVWAYFAVSQFLIIWSGNLPEEVTWYLNRAEGGWKALSIVLVAGHFVFPFAILLSQKLKKDIKKLAVIAVWVLLMRWLDIYWHVTPSLLDHHATDYLGYTAHVFSWLDVAAVLGLGGIWFALFMGQFKKRAVLPVQEPGLKEVLAHG